MSSYRWIYHSFLTIYHECHPYPVSLHNDVIDVFTLVYDVTQRDSFASLEMWLTELDTYATKKDLVKMLVGNKIDKASVEPIRFVNPQCLYELHRNCYDVVLYV